MEIKVKAPTDHQVRKIIEEAQKTYIDGLINAVGMDRNVAAMTGSAQIKVALKSGKNDPAHYFLAATESGFLIGGIWVTINAPDKTAHVNHIWVDEKYRGRGVLSALIKKASEAGRQKKVTKIWLNVFQNNQAIRLYKQLGARTVSRYMVMDLDEISKSG